MASMKGILEPLLALIWQWALYISPSPARLERLHRSEPMHDYTSSPDVERRRRRKHET